MGSSQADPGEPQQHPQERTAAGWGGAATLPPIWDDIQDERHQDALFQTMFVATQGAEGGRLNTDATMKERLEWQTLLVACSNASFIEYLTNKQKSTTAGMRRVFEIEFNKKDRRAGHDQRHRCRQGVRRAGAAITA